MDVNIHPIISPCVSPTLGRTQQLCGSHQDQMAWWGNWFLTPQFKEIFNIFVALRWDYFHMAAVWWYHHFLTVMISLPSFIFISFHRAEHWSCQAADGLFITYSLFYTFTGHIITGDTPAQERVAFVAP